MLFNVEYDAGHTVEGYLVPDGFSDTPRIRVEGDGTSLELDCLELRDAVRVSGRHATGLVGFRLDENTFGNLAGIADLTIRDARSGLLVYRRGREEFVRKRIVRLDLQLLPFTAIDHSLEARFQYAISGIERFGAETTLQVFHLNAVDSIYLAGRLNIRAFERFLEQGFEAVAMLTDPYFEMAERLHFLKRFSELPEITFGPRDHMILAAAAEHFAGVDLGSLRSLRSALRRLNKAAARTVRMPLTRQLTTVLPDEEPDRGSVAAALDVVSRFAITGLRDRPETFTLPMAELLGIDPYSIAEPQAHLNVGRTAALLREIPLAETLLEADLIVYHFARQALNSQTATPSIRTAS